MVETAVGSGECRKALSDQVAPRRASSIRMPLTFTLVCVCLALLCRVFLLDNYQVSTGSMAPAILGHHRECACPRCGFNVQVGLHERDDGETAAREHWYQRAFCPNCGATGLSLHHAPVFQGRRFLVNKAAFAMRAPRRWEVVVFRLFGFDFIKRILGLPGESVEIQDGDLYVDGMLCRKTIDEFKAMRVLAFDNNHQPMPMTWAARWESAPYRPNGQLLVGTALCLDATQSSDCWQLAAYRNFCVDTHKLLPLRDEYGYNGAEPCRTVPVHDTMLECDVEIQEGQGILALGITDGQDFIVAKLPVGASQERCSLHEAQAFSLPGPESVGAAGDNGGERGQG
jgi:signal peptidase I